MEQEKVISIFGSITVDELATLLDIPVTKLIGELFKNGVVATINQRIDFETATIIVEELGLPVKLEKKDAAKDVVHHKHIPSANAITRPPIVAVMGHVDHGKTTLLDTLLDKKTALSEAGGITQHISAYQVRHNDRLITFLDTPGHEAFAAIRQHGAQLTDIVVIVVAADDGVKPQTVEAINFARDANAKIIVAINKIDKEAADVNRVMAQLATDYGLNPEEWGGDTIMVPISAKANQNLDKLLDMILLVADIEELKADVKIPAEGLVIESHLETGKGAVANLLVEQGLLEVGDFVVVGTVYGKIRTLADDRGKPIRQAGPSAPVAATGFKDVPQFGDKFTVVKNEKVAKKLAGKTAVDLVKSAAMTNITSSDMLRMISHKHDMKDFRVVVKADVLGSLTSVIDNLKLIDTKDEISVSVIGSGVGNVNENDVYLSDEGTIIYGFNVEVATTIKRLAAQRKVQIKIFKVIYELLDDAKTEMSKLLDPEIIETEVGTLKVKGVFKVTKELLIAGGEITKGKITASSLCRAVHNKADLAKDLEVIGLQKEKQDVKELIEGEMGGVSLKTSKKVPLEIDDRLVFYTREVKQRSLQ
ncbi:translation initiation factor IF-2 [Candidatus Saccharibacteria bacterium]|nr:translation initiation factor IF-2 [Candidatus Saccharibacteria bacterium]